jgi:hypothetical protein
MAIVRIYLYAFWWWGYYQPFAFCEAMLEDWEMRTPSIQLQAVYEALREFRANYPEGYEKRNKPGWPKVKACLLFLRERLGLDGDVEQLSKEQQHTRAVMDFFLAEAYGYAQNGDLALAMQTYESARARFEALGDTWNASWLLFYMADLIKDVGQTDDERAANEALARAYCLASIRLAESATLLKRDPEVLGNVYRVLADLDFAAGDYVRTVHDDFHATAYAYAFQGIPNIPDSYTAEFFDEITRKAADRIAALIASDPVAGRTMRDALKARWAPFTASDTQAASADIREIDPTNADAIAAYIFPCPPVWTDFHDGAGKYQKRVLEVCNEAMLDAKRTDKPSGA